MENVCSDLTRYQFINLYDLRYNRSVNWRGNHRTVDKVLSTRRSSSLSPHIPPPTRIGWNKWPESRHVWVAPWTSVGGLCPQHITRISRRSVICLDCAIFRCLRVDGLSIVVDLYNVLQVFVVTLRGYNGCRVLCISKFFVCVRALTTRQSITVSCVLAWWLRFEPVPQSCRSSWSCAGIPNTYLVVSELPPRSIITSI